MTIYPQFISEGDQFQWYKNEVAIEGATSSTFEKMNAQVSDAGVYTLNVTNPSVPNLTLQSYDKTVEVIDYIGGIPRTEYNALKEFYNSTNGDTWENNSNWLDSTISVNYWYGITVVNEHVTQIMLDDNNLNGYLPASLANISNLVFLNVERNNIGSLPTNTVRPNRVIPDELGNLLNLQHLIIGYNSIQFNDLEAITQWPNFGNILSFSYKYQNGLHNQIIKECNVGETVKISLQNYYPATSDKYQWVKVNTPISGANDSVLVIDNAQASDEAEYYCVITNSALPNIEMTNYSTTLKVNHIHGAGISLKEYKALEKLYNSCNGANWKNNQNWLDTTNHSVKDWAGISVNNAHVNRLEMDSNNVVGELPDEIYDLMYLESLTMVQNQISGSLSGKIGQLTQLEVLSIANNNFSGTIPEEIGLLTNLWYLGCSNNNFSGSLPALSQCNNMVTISFNNNNFEGEILETYGGFSKLRFLELSKNMLSGKIPANIGNLAELNVLNLSHNSLIGPVPVELENLTKAYRIDISHNLFGANDEDKSATVQTTDANRQIPDELGKIIDIDTLLLGGNSLQFNDIEAIFSWDNFNDISEFTYSPQNKIGIKKSVETKEDSVVILRIDNYYPGASDKYQWYKGGVILPQKTTKYMSFESVKETDAGNYYCIITNAVATNLQLQTEDIQLFVNQNQTSAGIPQTEYDALVDIYNHYEGGSWAVNWLDTISGTVDDWNGITVQNGHVTGIDLPDLQFTGEIPGIFFTFDSLCHLNLSGNNFSGVFPTSSNIKEAGVESNLNGISYLNIANNKFIFSDLESVAEELMAIDTFIYSPQQIIGVQADTSIYKNENISIEIEGYVEGDNDVQNWYKNDNLMAINEANYVISSATLQDSGIYRLEVSNNLFPDLTLESHPYKLSVMTPVGIDTKTVNSILIYPNPADKKLYVDTQNKLVTLSLFNASGKKIFEKNDFTSQWINISIYPKGVYFIRIEVENSNLNYKVVFK